MLVCLKLPVCPRSLILDAASCSRTLQDFLFECVLQCHLLDFLSAFWFQRSCWQLSAQQNAQLSNHALKSAHDHTQYHMHVFGIGRAAMKALILKEPPSPEKESHRQKILPEATNASLQASQCTMMLKADRRGFAPCLWLASVGRAGSNGLWHTHRP